MKPVHLPAVGAPRHRPGRGSQVTLTERREIQRLYLIDGLAKAAIAQRFGRTRETIASILQGEDFERLHQQIEVDLFETARRKLKNNVGRAADGWIKAIGKAADKGDHKPSKDLLMHTGVIEPLGEHGAQGALVLVGIRLDMNGKVDAWRDCSTGQVYEESDLRVHGGTCMHVGMPGFPLPLPCSPNRREDERHEEALQEPGGHSDTSPD